MKKCATLCSLMIVLGTSFTASAMDREKCLDVIKATSDIQIAMLTSNNLDAAISKMKTVRDKTPSMQPELDAWIDVAERVDPDKSIATDEDLMAAHDEADMQFNEKYENLCGQY